MEKKLMLTLDSQSFKPAIESVHSNSKEHHFHTSNTQTFEYIFAEIVDKLEHFAVKFSTPI